MCYNTLYIYNPSKYISLKHGDPFRVGVRCGKCAECQKQNHDEWHFRTFFEFRETIRSGGYVLFDTLTYSDEHLPYVSDTISISPDMDFSCFSRSDIRYFFVRLRRKIAAHGYKTRFKYFLSCEYGSPEHTFRPHYHVLFFMPDRSISQYEMSKFVFDAWQQGRTDNYSNAYCDGFGNGYIDEHTYDDISAHGQKVCDYVAKYVEKDSEYQGIIDTRMDAIKEAICYDDDSPESRQLLRKTLNQVKQFHLQSHFYGLSALEDVDLVELDKTGMISMPVPDLSINKHIPIPLYFQRKLFYEMVEIDGKRAWQLNEDGKKFKIHAMERAAVLVQDRYSMFLHNLPSYHLDREIEDLIYNHFESINLVDLADYIVNKRGRFKTPVDLATIEQKVHEGFDFYYYGTHPDHDYFKTRFVTKNWLGNDAIGYSIFGDDVDDTEMVTPIQFAQYFTHHDSVYDYAIALYQTAMKWYNSGQQASFDFNQRLNKLYKSMNLR